MAAVVSPIAEPEVQPAVREWVVAAAPAVDPRKEKFSGTAECVECGVEIPLEGFMVNQVTQCPDCGQDLEVLGHDGDRIQVAPAPEEEEDWGE